MININIRKADKVNTEYALFISFEYDAKVVSIIRDFPTRYYNRDNTEWELPFNKLLELINKLEDYDIDITGEYVSLEKPKAKMPKGFEFKTKPFEHQIEAFNYGLNNDRWLLGDEMGLGKTKQSIDIAVAKKLQKGYKHCLIICGVNGLKWNWRNEVATHSNESAYILGQREKAGKLRVDGNKAKIDDLKNLDKINSYFLITNVESLRSEELNNLLIKYCKDNTIGMIITDEVHKMKNPTSQQGKAFLKLQADTMIAMTGTPLMNNPMDLYIILKWLGYEKHAFYSFKKHHCVMGGFGGYEILGYKHLDELEERLDEIMLRRKKEEVLDLPEKTYIDEYVDMSMKQKQIYDEVTADVKMNIDQIKIAPNPLAALIRMRQATGYTGILSSTIQESAKLDRMEELVEEAISNNQKVVIFSNWTQMTTPIYNRLCTKYNGILITGETKDADRQKYVEKFQNDDKCMFAVGTIGAMGTGLTMTQGTVEIFMDEPWNMALKTQAEDRCHRIGQKKNLTIYTLLCKSTIDERIHELVLKKGAMADVLVDGQSAKISPEVLEYLIG